MANISSLPIIRKEVVPDFIELIKSKVPIVGITYKILTEAVLLSISELLDNVGTNFNFGFSYDKNEIKYFKKHLVDIMTVNIDLIPGSFNFQS